MKSLLFLKIVFVTCFAFLTPLLLSLFFIDNQVIILVAGLGSFLASSLLIFLFLKPLKDLIKATENLGEGKFNQRIDIDPVFRFFEIPENFKP